MKDVCWIPFEGHGNWWWFRLHKNSSHWPPPPPLVFSKLCTSILIILCLLDRASLWLLKSKRPTWCHLLFYFISYVLNMFRTLIYPSLGVCDYSVELPHWSYCSWFDVCLSFGEFGLEWYPCCRLLQPATWIPLQPNHTETPTHIQPRTIRPMW